jgi:hypothetical protein
MIPRNVQFIDGSTFCDLTLSSISIESGNERFTIENNFLIDIVDHKFIHDFSNSSNVQIPADIEILGSRCFSFCDSISSLTFESNSHLKRIESSAFEYSSLHSIITPHGVQFIDGSAFYNVILFSISIERGNERFELQQQNWTNHQLTL